MMKSTPITILYLSANPEATDRLSTDRELRGIEDKLRAAAFSSRIRIVKRGAVRVEDLQRALLEDHPDVVHFSGHGTDASEIVLEAVDKAPVRVAKDALAELFALCKDHIRLAVFNACHSRPVAEAVAMHIDCAVGMNEAMEDEAAVDFAIALYQTIAHGRSVLESFQYAVNALKLNGRADAIVPELFTRSDVNAGTLFLVGSEVKATVATPGENILLVLDLASDNPIPMNEVEALLPGERPPRIFRASEFGAKAAPRGAVEFRACADAVTRMVEVARAEHRADEAPPHFHVVGRAALPIFAHLGMELSTWADVTLLNRRPDKQWDVLPLQHPAVPNGHPFFKTVRGLDASEPSESDGRIAVFISTNFPPNKESIRAFFLEQGAPLAGFIEVRTEAGAETLLDNAHAARAMVELVQIFKRIPDAYPHGKGLALFVAGPATLALMAARAVNRNIFGDVWVPNYEAGVYRFAAVLPWRRRTRSDVSDAPEARLERSRILTDIRDQIEHLRSKLRREHLPPAPILTDAEATRVLARLHDIEIAREPQGEVFDLRVSEGKMSFGAGLLDALQRTPAVDRLRVGQILFLHEIFHFDQNLQAPFGEGECRAGFALEEVDYWADAMAVGTLAGWEISRGGDAAKEKAWEIVAADICAVLSGIEAFDRFEHGSLIADLSEMRLRRYLVWQLQRARAATFRSVDDLWVLLGRRLFVEMVPLKGHLDSHYDKIVDAPISTTEILVVLQGRIMRTPSQQGINPAAIVDAVRTFNRSAVEATMQSIREQHRQVLVPWVR